MLSGEQQSSIQKRTENICHNLNLQTPESANAIRGLLTDVEELQNDLKTQRHTFEKIVADTQKETQTWMTKFQDTVQANRGLLSGNQRLQQENHFLNEAYDNLIAKILNRVGGDT